MIIGIDVDDVVADLMTQWLKEYNYDFDDSLTKRDILDWSVHEFVKPECGRKIYNYIEDRTIYDNIKPIPNALQAVNLLRERGRIIFITSPTTGAAGRKFLWLQEHGFIDSMDDYIEAKDKQLIKFDFLIDDNYHNVKYKPNNLLFNQPWNIKYDYPSRIEGWSNFVNTGKLI